MDTVRFYDWHVRRELFYYQETKLIDPDYNPEDFTLFDRAAAIQEFATPDEKYRYITMYKEDYDAIYGVLKGFRLIKTKQGENLQTLMLSTQIPTLHMERMLETYYHHAALTLLMLIKSQVIWSYFEEHYLKARVFYKKKKANMPLTPENSRCLLDCHNILKFVCRYLKYTYLDPLYDHGIVDVSIHRARNCYIKTVINRKQTDMSAPVFYNKLCFESVASIAMTVKTAECPFIALDLTNAYNNVYLDKLYPELVDDLPIALGLVRLCHLIKYEDIPLGWLMNKNKGIPQGCPISMDLFILYMDKTVKKIIRAIATGLGYQHGPDYEFIIYVDDILILLKRVSEVQGLLDIIDTEFKRIKFQINWAKSYKSHHPELACVRLTSAAPDTKYLGLYLETDPRKYMELVEKDIAYKYHNNPHLASLSQFNGALIAGVAFPVRIIQSIRGTLNFRLRPFAITREEKHGFLNRMGYPHIAEALY